MEGQKTYHKLSDYIAHCIYFNWWGKKTPNDQVMILAIQKSWIIWMFAYSCFGVGCQQLLGPQICFFHCLSLPPPIPRLLPYSGVGGGGGRVNCGGWWASHTETPHWFPIMKFSKKNDIILLQNQSSDLSHSIRVLAGIGIDFVDSGTELLIGGVRSGWGGKEMERVREANWLRFGDNGDLQWPLAKHQLQVLSHKLSVLSTCSRGKTRWRTSEERRGSCL